MKKSLILFFLSVLIAAGASAQNTPTYAFKVLINKGKNEIKSGGTWTPVKVGASIGKDDEIKVSENSYLGLVHVTGKSLELRDAKVYNATDLSAKVGPGASVLTKYTDFVISSNNQRKGNNLTATGAVHRGKPGIKLFLPRPEASVVYNNKIIFGWEKTDAPGPYIVTFNSMFGDELKKVEVAVPSVSIDLSEPSFENEDNIVVRVFSKTDKTKASPEDEYTIKRISKADRERIKASINELSGAVSEATAVNKVILAGFYESNNLLIDAATAYEEAIKLAPDVPEIQEAYRAFLIVHEMKIVKK